MEWVFDLILVMTSLTSSPKPAILEPPPSVEWQAPVVQVQETQPSLVFNWPAPAVKPAESSPSTVFSAWK